MLLLLPFLCLPFRYSEGCVEDDDTTGYSALARLMLLLWLRAKSCIVFSIYIDMYRLSLLLLLLSRYSYRVSTSVVFENRFWWGFAFCKRKEQSHFSSSLSLISHTMTHPQQNYTNINNENSPTCVGQRALDEKRKTAVARTSRRHARILRRLS